MTTLQDTPAVALPDAAPHRDPRTHTPAPRRRLVRYAKELCKQGTPVELKMLKGASHSFAAEKSAYAAVRWMTDRFKGRPPPNDCGRR